MTIKRPADGPAVFSLGGDLNAFFGLMLDNVGVMILLAGNLSLVFGFPLDFLLYRMVPGTAIGVLTGDLLFTWMAVRLAHKTGRSDVTAMPLGLDTPSAFGTVFLVLGPAYKAGLAAGLAETAAAQNAWYIGIAMLFASGLLKVACSPVCGLIRKLVPRAGLLGSLTAIALVIISFLPLLEILEYPVAGLLALTLILATLTAHWKLPFKFPGALASLAIGCACFYIMKQLGLAIEPARSLPQSGLRFSPPAPVADWFTWISGNWRSALAYLPVTIPLALATIVGGIDCAESAAAAGDDFKTGWVIAIEGFSTLAAALFGGVIQSTPYIGHPAYKAMGARSGYTLATALFVGAAGVFGFFDWIFYLIPRSTIFPILVFVGLEITAQSFRATPVRHYPALAFSCIPALAYLTLIPLNQVLQATGKSFVDLPEALKHSIQTLTMLSGGFIITSLLWGAALAHLIDGSARKFALAFAAAAGLSWFGVIHSPLPASPVVAPGEARRQLIEQGRYEASRNQLPIHWSLAYILSAAAAMALGAVSRPGPSESMSDQKDAPSAA